MFGGILAKSFEIYRQKWRGLTTIKFSGWLINILLSLISSSIVIFPLFAHLHIDSFKRMLIGIFLDYPQAIFAAFLIFLVGMVIEMYFTATALVYATQNIDILSAIKESALAFLSLIVIGLLSIFTILMLVLLLTIIISIPFATLSLYVFTTIGFSILVFGILIIFILLVPITYLLVIKKIDIVHFLRSLGNTTLKRYVSKMVLLYIVITVIYFILSKLLGFLLDPLYTHAVSSLWSTGDTSGLTIIAILWGIETFVGSVILSPFFEVAIYVALARSILER